MMRLIKNLILASLFVTFLASNTSASNDDTGDGVVMKNIIIGGQTVPVVAGGLYDRYRSNPPLAVIEQESPETDLSWFRTLKKTRVNIGFESYSPNFYYENSRISVVFTADMERLRELMPAEVFDVVKPLSIWPGRGLVVLTAYSYHYCDNDSYNEIALSVVTTKPGRTNLGPITLLAETLSNDYWGYVLKLPVDTELARVRGVLGYNLPKWKTPIRYLETEDKVVFEIADAETGATDWVLETTKLDDLFSEATIVTNNFINLGHSGELTTGHADARQLRHASSSNADNVNLTLSDGSFSTFLKSLQLGKVIKYEYVPSFQLALYAPEPLVITK